MSDTLTKSTWWSADYPAQFYAVYDIAGAQPAMITQWIDVAAFSVKPTWLPVASAMLAVSAADYSKQRDEAPRTAKAVQNGAIVEYAPPAPATA